MVWQQISVITDEHSAPEIAEFFSNYGALSVTYMDAEDEPVYEPALGETKIWSNTQVIALYDANIDLLPLKTRTSTNFQQHRLQDWLIETVADQPWERAWMEHYRPMKFADKLWVCPTGQEQSELDTVCLTLDPGLAFGTGTHPTTALCLEWLATHTLTGKTVIDYGCGSGILAVAAVLMGAKIAYAVDIDPQAITAAQMNAEKNRVQDKIVCVLAEQFDRKPINGDIVVANILAKPLIDMTAKIAGLVTSDGRLVLSGILAEQAEAVIESYRNKVLLDDFAQQEDWVRLAGAKH